MNALRMRLYPDHDGTGELEAQVTSDEFKGVSRGWFDLSEVRDFAQALRVFPLSSEQPPTIEGGLGSQSNLKIGVQPYNARGLLLVKVDLATRIWSADERELQQSVCARFLTEYAAVNRFADDLCRLLDGKIEEAILNGREEAPI